MRAKHPARILVVDDDPAMAALLADQLRDVGYEAELATAGKQGLEAARARPPDVAITDLRMEDIDGFELLEKIHRIDPEIPVLIMTAFGAIDSAVEAVKRGAFHYLSKPFQLKELLILIDRALSERRLRKENRALKRLVRDRSGLEAMVGRSEAMQRLYELIERVAAASEPVLVQGESGTGKELVARALHFTGPRSERPFVAVNCTALPETLLESELFGHVKGAFTGASAARQGLFAEADGGTLFLDEIGDMPSNLQSKLLRALEDGEIRPVGADTTRKVNVRVVAATNQNLEERVKERAFRPDLFYRLAVIPVVAPSLRERAEDVPLLAEHFLQRVGQANPGIRLKRFSAQVISALASYCWPGNVRELENVVRRLAIVCQGEQADLEDLRRYAPALAEDASPLQQAKVELKTLRELEDEYIAWVVSRCEGNKTRAAQILGIDVSTIHRRDKSVAKE